MIGLSPLASAHPSGFQPAAVRASSWFYPAFTLAKARSHGFASAARDYGALFRLAFATVPGLNPLTLPRTSNSLAHYAKGTRSLPDRPEGQPVCSHRLQAYGFRSISLPCSGDFSPFPHGTGTLSVTSEYLALPDGSGRFPQNFPYSVVLRVSSTPFMISSTGLSPSMVSLSRAV